MKTSKILLAMALPVAFAACSSEEIVENNNVSLQNRELLPAMAAVVESDVESRFSWNEEKFGWNKFTAEDNFAAGLTDGATLWDVKDLMLTNYIFNDEAGNGSYTTTSQMVEGTYFFYSYPGFETVAARQGVPFDLTSQKSVDFKKPAAAVEKNQLFVSALYKLDKATANEALPIKFVSYWSTTGMKIKNTTGDDLNIVRMLITADKEMPLKGIVAPSLLGDAAEKNSDISGLVYYNNGTSYVLPFDATAEDNVEWDDIKTIPMANTSVEGGLAEKTMMLTVENGELADDEEATVYFQMPAGTYEKVTVTFFVEVPTADGETEVKELEAVEFAKNAMKSEDSEENDITAFYRGGTTSAFGVLAGELAAHKITELDVLSATESGAYAASYEDLVQIIKDGVETNISNMGDLKIDDAVIALFKSTTAEKNLKAGEFYVFNNPIEITSAKAKQTLENIQVTEATITAGKISVDYNLNGNVKVEEGAELTISTTQTGKITNAGTVNVEKKSTTASNNINVTIADVEKTATYKPTTTVNLTIGGNWVALGNWTTTAPAEKSAIKLEGYPNNLKLKTSKNAEGIVEKSQYATYALTVPYGHNLYVAENVEASSNAYVAGNLTINGYVENKGTMKAATIYGAWNATAVAANGATVDNYGLLENAKLGNKVTLTANAEAIEKAVKNATTITNKAETANVKNLTKVTDANLVGRVDNNIGGFVSAIDIDVFATVTENTTGKINISDINTLYLNNMTWTDGTISTNIKKIYMNNVTLATSQDVTKDHTAFSNTAVKEFKNGTANYDANMSSAVIDGSLFNYDLEYAGKDMVGVTVKGDLKATSATLNWTDVTLNKVTVNDDANLTVKGQANKNAAGTITSYTVKTTTLNDEITGKFDAVVVENDAVLTIKNDVTLEAKTITVNDKTAVTGSKKGVLNVFGKIVGTVKNNGSINEN